MIEWEWTKKSVEPAFILDGARAIHETYGSPGIRLVRHWTPAETYLGWARAALARGGDDGWDSAAGWAKRAVCRQMDCILVHNHLEILLGRHNGEKAEYLSRLDVPGLPLLRDLVIDPRNANTIYVAAQTSWLSPVADRPNVASLDRLGDRRKPSVGLRQRCLGM
jgi:hypothetical protein